MQLVIEPLVLSAPHSNHLKISRLIQPGRTRTQFRHLSDGRHCYYKRTRFMKTESDVSSRPEAKLGNGLLLWLSLIRSLKLNLFQGFISKRSKIPEQEVMQVQFFVYSMPSKTC
ncbi:Hypothetical predicted protein [Podarcis lilfordi]|uniref:Uncharacterized protein n=1 Tax=Podarcis lilfordi TaxID=74358 RepID=A0AA35P9D6_9SAUR|nr:Hypothetical predicted protein [Podarcis lilfordi]